MNDLSDIPKPDRETTSGLADDLRLAAASYDVSEHPDDWAPLDILSNKTLYGTLTVQPDTAIIQGGTRFVAGRVYVTLQYGDKNSVSRMEDSFPARVYFHIDIDNTPVTVIDKVEVDTSSFYL